MAEKTYIGRLLCGHSAYLGTAKRYKEGKQTKAFCPWCHEDKMITGLEELK
jgi:hypothetical protein